jgi:hypothetical protein
MNQKTDITLWSAIVFDCVFAAFAAGRIATVKDTASSILA